MTGGTVDGVSKVAVIGAGTIGASWAAYFLSRGLEVCACDPAPDAADRLRRFIDRARPALQTLGLAEGADPGRVRFEADPVKAVEGAQFVQESGPDRVETKQALLERFGAAGNKVSVVTDTAGGVAARIGRGELFDLAVLTPATVAEAQRDGKVIVVTPIASVGLGLAVRQGAAKPDISSPAAFKAALLAAPSVSMVDPATGGTSGVAIAKMFEQMGIAAQMKPKLVLTKGGLSAEPVGAGKAAMALGQASELLSVEGVAMVGPFPAGLQSRTVYVAGMNPKAAEAPLILLAALAAPETQAILKQKGMGPP